MLAALARARDKHGAARILINCAGVGPAKRIVGRDGPMPLGDYDRVIRVNLIGSFNMMRLTAAEMASAAPLQGGERGVIVSTASVAAFEGQIGQAAYAASKGGIVALTMPAARELAQIGVRVLAIAPGQTLPVDHPAYGKGLVDGRAAAYVCNGPTCSLPFTEPRALIDSLAELR